MKKSFTLFVTIVLFSVFTYVTFDILQTKAIKSENIKNQFLYIQAKNHISFLEDYLKNIDLKDIDSLKVDDNFFDIKAQKSKDFAGYLLSVSSNDFNIRITRKFLIK